MSETLSQKHILHFVDRYVCRVNLETADPYDLWATELGIFAKKLFYSAPIFIGFFHIRYYSWLFWAILLGWQGEGANILLSVPWLPSQQ